MRKRCVPAVLLSAVLMLLSSRLWAQQLDREAAGQLMQMANQARAEHGLGPLRWDGALAAAAARHAQRMSREPDLSHQYAGELDLPERAARAGAHFQTIAENIALGQSAPSLHQQWMHSAPHRANILDPRLTAIGVAVLNRGGTLYAVQDFSHSVANLGSNQVEEQVGALLESRGVPPTGSRQAARQTCAMEHGSVGARPGFIMRWEGSDLSRLPGVLEDRIRTRRYHSSAVGACSNGSSSQGFTSYRVAVLLY